MLNPVLGQLALPVNVVTVLLAGRTVVPMLDAKWMSFVCVEGVIPKLAKMDLVGKIASA